MLQMQFFETNLYEIIFWFFIYSFIGWIIECIVISYENKHFTNRGFLHGPFCIVYGFGAIGFYFFLKPLSHNYILLFLSGMIMASILELFTAKLMIRIFGGFWWNYSKKPYNYKGILCLESSLAWGFLAVCLFGFIHKTVSGIAASFSPSIGKGIVLILLCYLIIDFSYTMYHTLKDGESRLPENSMTVE